LSGIELNKDRMFDSDSYRPGVMLDERGHSLIPIVVSPEGNVVASGPGHEIENYMRAFEEAKLLFAQTPLWAGK
jgi:hypothetical protein